MKSFRQFFLISFCLWFSAHAHALSCAGLSDKFFIECNQGSCAVAFRAKETPSFGSCNRNLLIESTDSQTNAVILSRVSDKSVSRFKEVSLTHRYYGDQPKTADELSQALKDTSFRAPRLIIKELPADTDLKILRLDLESKARGTALESMGYWAIEVAFFVLGLFLLYRSVLSFRRRNAASDSGNLLIPVAVQAVLLVAAVIFLLSPTWLILFGLLAPPILLIWVYELFICVRKRMKTSK